MKDKSVYILTALECIDLIEDYTAGFNIDTFLADRKTQDAVVRNLEVMRIPMNSATHSKVIQPPIPI